MSDQIHRTKHRAGVDLVGVCVSKRATATTCRLPGCQVGNAHSLRLSLCTLHKFPTPFPLETILDPSLAWLRCGAHYRFAPSFFVWAIAIFFASRLLKKGVNCVVCKRLTTESKVTVIFKILAVLMPASIH